MPEQLDDPDYRARGYPYHIPEQSYVMTSGVCALVDHLDLLPDLVGRRPILAVGSNMSPQQLGRKFPGPSDGDIPVTRVHLHDFDTVFSAHFTSYGSIPATLFPSPGSVVTLFINWLDPVQEKHMHGTEVASENYRFCRLNSLEMEVENGPHLDHVYVYLSSRGALTMKDNPVPMMEAKAINRRWQALRQDGIQEYVRKDLAPAMPLDVFIRENVTNESTRRSRTNHLHGSAMLFDFEFTELAR